MQNGTKGSVNWGIKAKVRGLNKIESFCCLTIAADRAAGKAAMVFPSAAANNLAIMFELIYVWNFLPAEKIKTGRWEKSLPQIWQVLSLENCFFAVLIQSSAGKLLTTTTSTDFTPKEKKLPKCFINNP